jgi:hypothetical protein
MLIDSENHVAGKELSEPPKKRKPRGPNVTPADRLRRAAEPIVQLVRGDDYLKAMAMLDGLCLLVDQYTTKGGFAPGMKVRSKTAWLDGSVVVEALPDGWVSLLKQDGTAVVVRSREVQA